MCRVERKVQKSVFGYKDRVETTKRLYHTGWAKFITCPDQISEGTF